MFADPEDSKFVDWVRLAAKSAGVTDDGIRFIKVEQHGIRAREYGALIRGIAACIIDVKHKGLMALSARLGSLADGVGDMLGHDNSWDASFAFPA